MKDKIFYCPDCLKYKGSWLGLSSHLNGSCKRSEEIRKNQLIFAIIKTEEYLNEVPGVKQMNEQGPVSERPILDCFGTYNNALLESGLSPKNPKNVPNKRLIGELKRISRKYCDDTAPKINDIQNFSKFSHSIFVRRYGSWNKAVKQAGFSPNIQKNIGNEKLFSELKRVSEEHCGGGTPRSKDIEIHSKYSVSTFLNNFGSWNESLRDAGFEPREHGSWVPSGEKASRYGVCGTEHPNWKGGYKEYYGSSWISQQRKALDRDDYRCQSCFKSENNIGRKPDVHHILPVRNWNVEKEHDKMNNLKNLICLCRKCHKALEGKWEKLSAREFSIKAKNYEL